MSQVELPQLSLQRYVDLVKRRRWQLVPVSAIGLLVGGLVAFLIPRYFVADTLITHQEVAGETEQGSEDPFAPIIDSARLTIPQAVPEAMAKLKWPEITISDPFERAQAIKEVQSRVAVPPTSSERGKSYVQMRVVYRDQQGDRAAVFLNTLVEVWIEKRLRELREPAQRAMQLANDEATKWGSTYDLRLRDKRLLEQQYGLRPDLTPAMQQGQLVKEMDDQRERNEALLANQAKQDKLQKALAAAKEQLATIKERVPPEVEFFAEAAKSNPQALFWYQQVEIRRMMLPVVSRPGSENERRAKRDLSFAEEMLRVSLVTGLDPDGLMPNPKFALLREQIVKGQEELALLDAAILQAQKAEALETKRLENLRIGYELLEKKVRDITEAESKRADAMAESDKQKDKLAKLTNQLPVTQAWPAVVPPRPTDPNILVVALIGCVLGLAAAIGLILLLDLLQGSFKTADDVERGLPVPMLGGLSHLETDEERLVARAGRRRVSVVAFGFVALVVVVVTIFYVAPTRLPPAVRDLLAMLLGS